ncbi:sensor histidine kinase [Micromonospora sp. CPCC 206061]|uniref:sensor histidine kinase n=1 Tax=Micromonospora sp. CPCC 206061 TaxID=3122410 RepID=UPI002FF3A4E5
MHRQRSTVDGPGVAGGLHDQRRAAVRAAAGADRRRADRLLGVASRPAIEPDPPLRREAGWLAVHAVTGIPVAIAVLVACVLVVGAPVATLAWWALPAGESFAYFVPITTWSRALTLPPVFGAVAAGTLWWVAPVLARWHARACRAVLAPSAAAVLTARVERLAATRADALDAHAAELRRIERDLHDGTQARLVTIAIQLGVAQRQRTIAPHLADQLVERARAGVEDALAELRGVARSVYPPILADRGLVGAVHALVADCPAQLRLRAGPLGRLPAAVEGAAYFVVAEALTNIAKHSQAAGGVVELGLASDRLVLVVSDDGTGGADESRGTGLAGIRRRVAALDGEATIASPRGGPTTIRVELPCAS